MTRFNITKNSKPLDKSLYTWDEETKTLSTIENNLVLDFKDMNNCTFKTGSNCIFKTSHGCTFDTGSNCTFITSYNCTFKTAYNCIFDTGSDCKFKTTFNCIFKTSYSCTFDTDFGCTFKTGCDCTFKTSYGCTFDTGSNCTFRSGSDCMFKTSYDCVFDISYNCILNTGSNCVFKAGHSCTFNVGSDCVLTRRDIFEFYEISNVKNIKTAPHQIKGYIKNDYYYLNGKKQYKAIIADGILSEIIKHKGNVYKVKNYREDRVTYLVKDGDTFSHGETLKEAKEGLIYKLSNRDTSKYKEYTLGTKVNKKEAIQMYRCITGACERGTRTFVENLDKIPRNLTVKKIIELTEEQYGNNAFKKFFEGVTA